MDYIDPYRDSKAVEYLVKDISSISLNREIRLMEVCGTHTMSIRKFGINNILPSNIKLLSGPGCPVCVTPTEYIDKAIKIAEREDVIIATFGDMMRVPGTNCSLEKAKANGASVYVVYSPIESLELAEKNRDKKVVFLAIGFETTAPSIGITVLEAYKRGLKNFFVLEGNKLIPPAIESILEDRDSKIDGFILPGHVCTITGYELFEFVPKRYNIPCAVSGFEPVDILLAIRELVLMVKQDLAEVKNLYPRAVKREGNLKAKEIIDKVFVKKDSNWRGLGNIKDSGLFLKEDFRGFDVLSVIDVGEVTSKDNPLCLCGEILKGKAYPYECPLFGKACTPISPKGPCMISSQGTCAAYYKYGFQKVR